MNHVLVTQQLCIEHISSEESMNHILITQYILNEFSLNVQKLIFKSLQFDPDRMRDKYKLVLNRK